MYVMYYISHLEIADISEHNGQMPKMKRPTIIYINNWNKY